MIQTTIIETNPNETEFIGIYEGNQNKIEYADKGISLDEYTLDENAVVGGVVWKPVVGYEEFYEVSDYGAVRILYKIKDFYHKLRKSKKDRYGYSIYHLRNGVGNGKYIGAHRIVAEAFIVNDKNKPTIDHIDGNKFNNNVSNLRWATNKENSNNKITLNKFRETLTNLKKTEAYKKLKRKTNKKSAIKTAFHVVCIETGEWFNSAYDASKKFGITHSNILLSCGRFEKGAPQLLTEYRGKRVYHFRYATEEENAVNLPKYIEYVNELTKNY